MLDPSVLVHEKALCESQDIGPGTRIWAFAHIMEGARVGRECNVGDHVFIESGAVVGDRVTIKNAVLLWDKVVIEDDVFLGPSAVFTNDLTPRAEIKKGPDQLAPTVVQRGASIGANATIVCGITIGSYAFVGAGAVVVGDVPSYALMVGNPARRLGWACECGEQLPESLQCSCTRSYEPDDGLLKRK